MQRSEKDQDEISIKAQVIASKRNDQVNICVMTCDGVSYDTNAYVSEFRIFSVEIDSTIIKTKLHVDSEYDQVYEVDNYFVFLRPEDFDNVIPVKLNEGTKLLSVPAPDLGRFYSREVDHANKLAFVIGLGLTAEKKEKAKALSQASGLVYVGDCDINDDGNVRTAVKSLIILSLMHKNLKKHPEYLSDIKNRIVNGKEITPDFIINYSKRLELNTAYTKGAVVGLFRDRNLPADVSRNIASYLNRKTGAKVAQVSTESAKKAKEHDAEQQAKRDSKKTP